MITYHLPYLFLELYESFAFDYDVISLIILTPLSEYYVLGKYYVQCT